jgi:hypothetical protein
MRELEPTLEAQALLYANGELDGADGTAFEQRLAADQTAREALAQAVELVRTVNGAVSSPNPDYRLRVQARLLPRGLWSWVGRRRFYRGHPVAWLLTGAAMAAAVLLLVGVPSAPSAASAPEAKVQPTPSLTDTTPAPTEKQAQIWGDLTNTEHLAQAVAEVKGRRDRWPTKKPLLDVRSSKGLKQG